MKRKILAIILLLALLFNNYVVFAAEGWPSDYERPENGPKIADVATTIQQANLHSKFKAKSQGTYVNISEGANHFDLKGTYTIERSNSVNGAPGKYLWAKYDLQSEQKEIKLTGLGSVIYSDALQYGDNTYDVRLDILEIYKEANYNASSPYVYIVLGKLDENATPDIQNAKDGAGIAIGTGDMTGEEGDNWSKVYVKTKYTIIDKQGNEIGSSDKISGLFGITDLDLKQGIHVEGFTVNTSAKYICR